MMSSSLLPHTNINYQASIDDEGGKIKVFWEVRGKIKVFWEVN